MKLILAILCLTLFTALVYARDLDSIARRERARRQALALKGRPRSPGFTMDDLERYRAEPIEPASPPTAKAPRREPSERDRAKARSFWEREKKRHERELARLDASIRRLEWRLEETKARKRPGERLFRDTTLGVLEDSLEALRAERKRVDDEFREKARKAGALPGWIR